MKKYIENIFSSQALEDNLYFAFIYFFIYFSCFWWVDNSSLFFFRWINPLIFIPSVYWRSGQPMGALHVSLRGRVFEGGRSPPAVCRQRSADGRSAARRLETGPMATIMAGLEPQKTLRKTFLNHTCVLPSMENKLSCVKLFTCALFGLFVLCFRGRDPSEAAAHRQEGGGCFQLSSYRVGKTNMLVCIRLHTGRLLRWSPPAACCLLPDWLPQARFVYWMFCLVLMVMMMPPEIDGVWITTISEKTTKQNY